jgi:predicted Abi (CAAX) family protease
LESLAGSRPQDDVIVALPNAAIKAAAVYITRDPVQITGRYYGLVRILDGVTDDAGKAEGLFRVAHFNSSSHQFDSTVEIVRIPEVVFAKAYGSYPSTTRKITEAPQNKTGWYIYGAKNAAGRFVVQAIAPRCLLRLQPDQVITGKTAAWKYLKKQAWQVEGQKGTTKSVLLDGRREEMRRGGGVEWQEGDRALVIHTYGGIGGNHKEPAAKTPIFFGHFAYGEAMVVREPLADELMFDIRYHQVYTQNVDGIIAGTLAWSRFLGDRQVGWLGNRPICDLVIKLDAFTGYFDVSGHQYSVLNVLLSQLEVMTARYRIGDGTGGTYVGAAHNCAQDSNQAMYAALKRVQDAIQTNPKLVMEMQDDPGEAERFEQLTKLKNGIRRQLLPFGAARADWHNRESTLGISPEEDVWEGLLQGLRSWHTLLPRVASEAIAKQFLNQGAQIWVLRTNQVGGDDPDIEPIAPTPFG